MLIIVFELVLPLWCIWKALIHDHDAQKMESNAYQRYVRTHSSTLLSHCYSKSSSQSPPSPRRLAFSVTVIFVCMPVNASKPHSFSYGQEDGAVSVNLITHAWYIQFLQLPRGQECIAWRAISKPGPNYLEQELVWQASSSVSYAALCKWLIKG